MVISGEGKVVPVRKLGRAYESGPDVESFDRVTVRHRVVDILHGVEVVFCISALSMGLLTSGNALDLGWAWVARLPATPVSGFEPLVNQVPQGHEDEKTCHLAISRNE